MANLVKNRNLNKNKNFVRINLTINLIDRFRINDTEPFTELQKLSLILVISNYGVAEHYTYARVEKTSFSIDNSKTDRLKRRQTWVSKIMHRNTKITHTQIEKAQYMR